MAATPKSLYVDSPPDASALPVRTVEEVISEAGEKVAWVVEGLLARGAVTEFSGLAKKGAKQRSGVTPSQRALGQMTTPDSSPSPRGTST
ncbi:MAG TPA: hypothetical protein VK357_14255 [Rubrobacteraceae bacterium]|jgi:hypothetical protein|nr:hypothetical protein [Rubrobacteraceae bacterium]